jgi:hypothetical protein
MHAIDKQACQYSKTAADAILERGKKDFEILAAALKERKRLEEGRGRDWSEGLLIERYPVK